MIAGGSRRRSKVRYVSSNAAPKTSIRARDKRSARRVSRSTSARRWLERCSYSTFGSMNDAAA